MTGEGERWVARLRPGRSSSLESLLAMPLGLDVWERGDDALVVAAGDAELSELERRGLARVERISTAAEWQARAEAGGTGGSDEIESGT